MTKIMLTKIKKISYFFESDVIFRQKIFNIKIKIVF